MNAKGAQVNHQLLNLSSRGSAVADANDPCSFKPRSSRIMFLGLLIISLFLCQSAYSAPQDFHYNGRYYLVEYGGPRQGYFDLWKYIGPGTPPYGSPYYLQANVNSVCTQNTRLAGGAVVAWAAPGVSGSFHEVPSAFFRMQFIFNPAASNGTDGVRYPCYNSANQQYGSLYFYGHRQTYDVTTTDGRIWHRVGDLRYTAWDLDGSFRPSGHWYSVWTLRN